MKQITIVDYGLGNLRSVKKGLSKAGSSPIITSDPELISGSDGIILPGVGAFREGMAQLTPLKQAIIRRSKEVPLLGICLGMQMLLEWSEEHGRNEGLGLIPGDVRRFPHKEGYKIPHMGWNSVTIEKTDDPLFSGINSGEYFYFVHSYFASTRSEYTLASTEYITDFASAVSDNSVYGLQFHPEKSGSAGLKVLKNFIDIL